jgi:hypothetical protein
VSTTVRALIAAFLVATPVAGQGTGLSSRVDANTLREVQPVLDAAGRDSLPLTALESKVLEGVAKNVPPQQIGVVVRALAEELRGARLTLRDVLPNRSIADGEIVAAAMARRQGIGAETLRSLSMSGPDVGSLEIPMTVLGELVRRGVPTDEAASAMSQVMRAGVPMQVAAQIPGRVDGGMSSGAPPGRALADALRNLNIPSPPGPPVTPGPPGSGGPPSGRGRP